MKVRLSSVTDIGKVRDTNEDAVVVCPNLEKQDWGVNNSCYIPLSKYGALMVVADGMGGANAGEIASSIAVETIKKYFTIEKLSNLPLFEDSICCYLRSVINNANDAILNHAITNPETIGLGTTVVITWIIENKAYIAWCGDSRCYCFNQKNGLKKLTKDHSYVQELVDQGKITPQQALNHPDSNMITKCLGDTDVASEPDIITYSVKEGDILLSCSDGLCGYCRDESIKEVLSHNWDDITKCLNELLNISLNAGGYDNITIALCSILPNNQQARNASILKKLVRFISK